LVLLLVVRQRDNSIATTLATIFLFIFFKQGGDKTKIHRTAWPSEAKLFPIPWPSA